MASTGLVPHSPDDGGSALSDLLRDGSTIWETAGAAIPRDLLQFGLYGSAICIMSGLLALAFPSAHAIRHGEFFLVMASVAAAMASLMHTLAIPAICSGVALLVLDLYLMQGPQHEGWRLAIMGQAALGGIGAVLGTIFLALVLFNLALWIVIIALAVGAFFLLLAALAGGG